VTDSAGGVLQGASVTVEPAGVHTVTSNEGLFSVSGLPAGGYTLIVDFIGFEPFQKGFEVTAGATTRVDPVLQVAGQSSSVLVTAERPRGEAEQINRERTADNIVQVLSSEVITSLPNANIADALGRLPSVTLERDEGEGKYVQIRGTEPRLSNLTIDGVNVPSPESGVRQVKLDTLASDLVESVEINKTLQANMDGDGIGGSVNLRTKTAAEKPVVMMSAMGGYTPIIGGRGVDQFNTTLGRRFDDNRLGILIGGTYDWNGRGINDLEPSPTVTSLAPHYDSIDFRDYMYYRTRWGISGSGDYRMNNASSITVRGLYSTFRNWGQKWVYTLNDGDVPSASMDWRRPDYAVGNMVVSGRHVTSGQDWLSWDVSGAQSRMLQSGGNGGAKFKWNGAATSCTDSPATTTNPFEPMFAASCFTAGPTNNEDIANYKLSSWNPASIGESAQLNLQASAAYGHTYHSGDHVGTLEVGAKVRNGHKYTDSTTTTYAVAKGVTIPMAQFTGTFSDASYYDGAYPWPSANSDFLQMQNYVFSHPTQFTVSGGPGGANKSMFTLTERVTAAYAMNTYDLSSRARLIAGVRVEQTHLDTLSFNANTGNEDFANGGNYTDVLPSASFRFAATPNTTLRFAYSRALSRPDPQDITQAVGVVNDTQNPPTVSLGNPDLHAEHAHNFDILLEQYLSPLGLVSAGYFVKELSDPIIATQTRPTSGPFAGYLVSQPGNAGSATLQGFEVGYQQHLRFLPSGWAGLGFSANYSYTTSETRGLPLRTDSPALLRQAPHTWNVSPTFDRGPLSMRLGVTYNAASIFAYQYQNLNSDGTPMKTSDLTAGGVTGPGGDNYLYAHMQVDAQASLRLRSGVSVVVYGLNLTNEVFGFYNGSPEYVVQREFYKPTFAIGVRLNPSLR